MRLPSFWRFAVYHAAGNVTETHEHRGEFKNDFLIG